MKCPHCGENVDELVGDCERLTAGAYKRLCQDCRDDFQQMEDDELEDE